MNLSQNMDEFIDTWPLSSRLKNSLKDAGYMTLDSLKEISLDDLKNIDGLGSKSISELRDYVYNKYKVVFKKKPKPKKLDNSMLCQQLVKHFLGGKPIKWPLEMLKANQLLKERSLEEWLKIPPFEKLYSLGFFFHHLGKKYVSDHTPKKLVVEERKVEEVSNVTSEEYEKKSSAPITLKDFMKIK